MPQGLTVKKFLTALAVFAAILYAGLAVAYDHHNLGEPQLNPCPVCAAAHVLSFADNSVHSWPVNPNVLVADLLPPGERNCFCHSTCLKNLNYRAPPLELPFR